jgi:hypothetical protein
MNESSYKPDCKALLELANLMIADIYMERSFDAGFAKGVTDTTIVGMMIAVGMVKLALPNATYEVVEDVLKDCWKMMVAVGPEPKEFKLTSKAVGSA